MYPPHHFGGYELVWRSAVDHLRGQGHDVRVLATDTRTGATEPDPPCVHRELRWTLRQAEFQPVSVRERIALARHNHTVLDRHLAELRPDVVTWWSMGGLTLTMLESVRRRGLPAVAFVQDDWLDYGRWADGWSAAFRGRRAAIAPMAERAFGFPTRVHLAEAARYVFGSERTRQHALTLGLELRHTEVVRVGIHVDYLTPAPEREWSWRLLYVGRLDPRKGVDTAVEAISRLPEAAHLELIGGWDSREEDRLRGQAEQLGVANRVHFAGHAGREEIVDAYARADAVVFPVRWEEPWGLVPLEAMGRGRPVVATGRGGSAEYLRDGENCLLFDVDSAAQLAASLEKLAADGELRGRLRHHGVATAAKYTEPIHNEGVERALHDAVAASGRASIAGR